MKAVAPKPSVEATFTMRPECGEAMSWEGQGDKWGVRRDGARVRVKMRKKLRTNTCHCVCVCVCVCKGGEVRASSADDLKSLQQLLKLMRFVSHPVDFK